MTPLHRKASEGRQITDNRCHKAEDQKFGIGNAEWQSSEWERAITLRIDLFLPRNPQGATRNKAL
jgi:hypothetical protein